MYYPNTNKLSSYTAPPEVPVAVHTHTHSNSLSICFTGFRNHSGTLPNHSGALPNDCGRFPNDCGRFPWHFAMLQAFGQMFPGHSGTSPRHFAMLQTFGRMFPGHSAMLQTFGKMFPEHSGTFPGHFAVLSAFGRMFPNHSGTFRKGYFASQRFGNVPQAFCSVTNIRKNVPRACGNVPQGIFHDPTVREHSAMVGERSRDSLQVTLKNIRTSKLTY
jgi:hypothetical protein